MSARVPVVSPARSDAPAEAPRGRAPRVAGLDTLRAFAVVAVIGYHLNVPFLRGGYLGVTLFFVISGYLITRLLLQEVQGTGHLSLLGFWRRRARRLLPAAYLTVVACLAWATLFQHELLPRLRGDSLAALGYVSNWWLIFHKVSYFDSWGLPSPLTHFWTLGVEEQFYLVWPLALVGLLALARRGVTPYLAVAVVALASAAALALGYSPHADPSRVYMGTDTRAFELLIGVLIAMMLHLRQIRRRIAAGFDALVRRGWWLLVAVGGLVLLVQTVAMPDDSAFLYRGGLVIAALASAALVLGAQADPIGLAARVDHGVLGAVGRRSYSLYLWHYPVFVAVSTARDITSFSLARAVATVAITALLAEGCYRWVELPIQRNGVAAWWQSCHRASLRLPTAARRAAFGLAGVPFVLAGVGLSGGVGPPAHANGPVAIIAGSAPVGAVATPGHKRDAPTVGPSAPFIGPTVPDAPTAAGSPSVTSSPTSHPSATPPARSTPTRSPSPRPTTSQAPPPRHAGLYGPDTIIVGDSLMIDISRRMQQLLPGITINAKVGMQPWTGLGIASKYGQFDHAGGAYILGIGTNGAIDGSDLAAFCRAHAAATVVLITPHVDRPWEKTSISAIWAAAHRYRNVRVVDFHKIASGHPEFFSSDGVHLTASGVTAMTQAMLAVGR